MVDLHPELCAARMAIARAGDPVELLSDLGSAPLSEAGAAELAKNDWQNAEVRQQTKLGWQRWAQAKYRRLAGR